MRVLDIHAEHCSFETVAAPPAEDAPDPEPPTPDPAGDAVPAPREGGFDDCLAAFVAVEGADARDPELVATRVADHLQTRAADLRLDRVVCYPCPALIEQPADHATTVDCCRALAAALPGHLDAVRAPVGWHHALDLETAGHPFGETISRFTADETPPEREVEWTVVTPDGERHDPEVTLDGLGDPTRTVFGRALEREKDGWRAPPAAADGDRTTLAEPDGLGGRRLLPAGRLVHDLLAEHVRDRALGLGAAPVETLLAPDPSNSDVARLLGALGESVPGESSLRLSTCLGACALLRDADLRPADCPVRLFECGPVGRDDGTATVPALHAALIDRDAAWAALREFATLACDLAEDCGLDVVPVCRVGPDVPADRVDALADALDQPVLVGRDITSAAADEAVYLSLHDPGRDPADAPHVRLDPGLAERAGIEFDVTAPTDGEQARDHPVLVSSEPLGSLGGTHAALGPFPAWLAPTQVRFVTVDDDHRDRAVELADTVADAGLRTDIDDRQRPVGERLDRAERDGAPFVIVVGAREADAAEVKCWDRREGSEVLLSPAALAERVAERVEGFPRRQSGLSRFVGEGPLWGTRTAE